MAAVDPSESPKRPKSPAEEAETSGEQAEAAESGPSLNDTDETTCDVTAERPGDEQTASVGNDGAADASHSEVSVGSGAGADKTSGNLPEHLRSAENTAEAPGDEQRPFEWSETEDDDEEMTTQQENTKCDLSTVKESAKVVQQNSQVDENIPDANDGHKEKNSQSGKQDTEKPVAEHPVGNANGPEQLAVDKGEPDRGDDAEPTAKQKKCRLVCKECGKRFNRREMFNLHRHFHAHEDELTPLTCKQCGLTFQHRSSLIKHRNEHKAKEEEIVTPKNEVQTKDVESFECAECEKVFSTVDKLRDHNCSNTVEKPYHCPLCRQEFQFRVSVTKHMMTHSQETMLTCQESNQSFPNNMTLRYHQRCHTALKPYECPECGMVFKHYSVMEDHRRRHTKSLRSHLCNTCGKTFKYSSLLHQHQYLHTGQKPFRCPECGKTFAFAQNLKAHCRQHRPGKTNYSSEQQPCKQPPESVQEAIRGPGKENTQSEQPKRTFNCPLCPQTYNAPANLRAHMLIHEAEYEMLERTPKPPKEIHWEKGYNCPHCPCVYRQESSLNLHILSYHKSIAQYLEKVATPPKKQLNPLGSDYVQGKWKSDGVKSYKCSECGKAFRHRSVLELHMRIHSKDKPYQCKVCGKGFRFSSYLQQHLIIHTGKKPYKCPDCGKDFAFMQNMKTHQKLHQEKPFRCTMCRKGYSDQIQLERHMMSHNGDKPHKCDMCDKSFGLAFLLRDHKNTHTGERPHRCDECHKSFSWFSSLLVHQKIHARKHQGFSQYNSVPGGTRMRGRGSRGRRGGKFTWGWSRALGGSGVVNSQQLLYPVSAREVEMHRRAGRLPSMLSPQLDINSRQHKEQWLSEMHPQPVQWKVDGGEVMPVPSSLQHAQFESPSQTGLQQHHQRSPGWADSSSISQSGSTSAQRKDSPACIVSSHLVSVPNKSSPLAGTDKPVTWNSTPISTVLPSTSSVQHDFSGPSSYLDGAALWSIRPAPLANSQGSTNKLGQEHQMPRWPVAPGSIQKELSTPPKKEDSRLWEVNNPQVKQLTVSQPEKQYASGLAGASTSSQKDQSSAMPISTPVSVAGGSTLWDIQTSSGIPKTKNSPEKLVNNQDFQLQQKQVTSGWAVHSQSATQKVPISIQYEAHRFTQGMGAPVWSFQSNPVGPQTLLTGQLKPGNGQELQQQPMVTGTQIIINQPSPFFSPPLAPLPPLALPGPHPLHSVAVGALPRPPHPNIFFTPQAVMSERPQTLPLPQLAPRTEPHKLGPRLPFAPERLLQCMICGCSLPRELDLQMHYLQHAQGEI